MKCGLEIHQRLRGRKLFCESPCPEADEGGIAHGGRPFVRRFISTSSELGVQDAAAAFEQSRERRIKYTAEGEFTSLMEEDEEPPVKINAEALNEAIRICFAFGAKLPDELHIMRKTVVDGSNTSGFQRTAILAFGGSVKTSLGDVPLQTICIEEESAVPAGEEDGFALYSINRLGVPLVEIATEPTLVSGGHARECAEKIGMALRMSPAVMRGLGTIRQDVNVSIEGGARVEIKGLQDIAVLPLLVENEVKRQQALIQISSELELRGAKAEQKWIDATEIFARTECAIISRALQNGGVALAAALPKHSSFLGRELYASRRYGTEISDYGKAAGGVKGLIHSDESMEKYKISQDEIDELSAALSLKDGDAFIIIADAAQKCEKAMAAVLSRASVRGVPKETRKADENGGSSYMRPLPGAARMYPETDIPPLRLCGEIIEKAKANPLDDFESKRKKLAALLGAEMGEQMVKSRHLGTFERLVANGADAKLAANTLEQSMTALRREGVETDKITESVLGEVFSAVADGKIARAAIPELLRHASKNPSAKIDSIAKSHSLLRIRGEELESLWAREGGDMKNFMSKYRLVVEGADIAPLAKGKK